jgi:hypothetical protein
MEFPENFSENGARPVQFLGRYGRLIGWARSFSDPMTVTDNTIVGGCLPRQLTRIAGRDVIIPDGHTVGKTFCRRVSCKVPNAKSWPAAHPLQTAPRHLRPTRTKGLTPSRRGGIQFLPGFLRSNMESNLQFQVPNHAAVQTEINPTKPLTCLIAEIRRSGIISPG